MDLSTILGERLAIVGGTGAGKSYATRVLVEKVLAGPHGRVGIIDPTGVWHGLRVTADGKGAGFPVVIFGGDRSDVPLIETAGRVVAQAVASTHQSWVIDTSALKTKAAERRFMLDFLDALFEANREDITLVVDEADRFSPQRMNPESTRLHERMEEIVRRGRVRGFTPWLITQRPASLNKDVLSQATAMICMRMTGAHDRSAMADVIEGQADKATAREIIGSMPNHKTGHGLVWAPQRGILQAVHFPKIVTLDTMRAPKPGERRSDSTLPPIDLGALREKLATVEAETKANDPRVLRTEIARLKAELAGKPARAVEADPKRLEVEYQQGVAEGRRQAQQEWQFSVGRLRSAADFIVQALESETTKAAQYAPAAPSRTPGIVHRQQPYTPPPASTAAATGLRTPPTGAAANRASKPAGSGAAGLTGPQQRVLDALVWMRSVGIARADKTQLAIMADQSPTSGSYMGALAALMKGGLITYPVPGSVEITAAGDSLANRVEAPPTTADLHASLERKLPASQWKTLRAVISAYPSPISKDALAQATEQSPTSGSYMANLAALNRLGFISYPRPGQVVALPILFVE